VGAIGKDRALYAETTTGIGGRAVSDLRTDLRQMFKESSRFANFGQLIMRMHVIGVRCHSNTLIDIKSPVTAFCGLNGTGKSTLLQLAAVAYQGNNSKYFVKDFMITSPLDPHPFLPKATIEYTFWQERDLKPLTLSYNANSKKWQGYRRRLTRVVFFAGVGSYLPRIEQHDFVIRHANHWKLAQSDEVNQRIKDWTCNVLGCSYENMQTHIVRYSQRKGDIVSVQRTGTAYSEAHMGYGQGRSQYLITVLESLPKKSLVLIEEPETSLHQSAQHAFGKYLLDVAKVNGHQILLTTHSEHLLRSLPPESRIYLERCEQGITPILGLMPSQAASLMAQGSDKAITILVEDDCALAILREIIRKFDPALLDAAGVFAVGDAHSIKITMQTLKATGLPVVAVRDGDQQTIPSDNIYKLPGNQPPEKELFASSSVRRYIQDTYRLNIDDFFAHFGREDHHSWFDRLAERVTQDQTVLLAETAREYIKDIPETETRGLLDKLKESMRR
jgi:predicted ATPase